MIRLIIIVIVFALLKPAFVSAQEMNYSVGLNYSVSTSAVKLDKVDNRFTADLLGHSSGIYFLKRVNKYLHAGFQTLVANYDKKGTDILYQSAGPVVEFRSPGKYFAYGRLILAGVLVDAGSKNDQVHYRGNGGVLAPEAGIGHHWTSFHLALSVKYTAHFGSKNIDTFNQIYAGVNYGWHFK